MAGTYDAHSRSRTVLLVVRMQNEEFIQGIDNDRVLFVLLVWTLKHHLVDVLNVTQAVITVIQWRSAFLAQGPSDQNGELGHDAHN